MNSDTTSTRPGASRMKRMDRHRTFFGLTKNDLFELLICLALAALFVILTSGAAFGQGNVGINNPTPHPKSLLDLTSTDKGLLVPRMTAAQRTAMFPTPDATGRGMLVYQTDAAQGFHYYDGASWIFMDPAAVPAGWRTDGNAGTDAANDFVGTTDAQGLRFRTNGTERMRIAANGNLAIGAQTDPVNYRLYVENNAVYPGVYIRNMFASGYTGMHLLNDQGNVRTHFGIGNSTSPTWTNLGFVGTTSAHPFVFTTGDQERMRIAANGNVGIGTTAPAWKLDVHGVQSAGRFVSSGHASGSVIELRNMAPGAGGILGAINFNDAVDSYPGQISYAADNAMTFRAGGIGNERMRIDGATGHVGIGIAAPSVRLEVQDNTSLIPMRVRSTLSNAYAVTQYINQNNSAWGHVGIVNPGAATHAGNFIVGSASATPVSITTGDQERVRIAANGNVGIGTNTTNVRLHVQADQADVLANFRNLNAAGWSAMHFDNSAGNARTHIGFANASAATFANTGFAGTTSNHPFVLTTNNAERLRIAANGNVGIGTNAPGTKLEVNGYTKLGTDAPAVRMKKLTGTTAATEGGFVDIAHGVAAAKILAVQVLIEWTTGSWIGDGYMQNPEYQAHYLVNGTNIRVFNHGTSSGAILSKPVKVLVTYEE